MRIKPRYLFLTETYYKMFFLITHLIIGKYYPSFFTQFIIGCTCYAISFVILKDFITVRTYEHYKYHMLFLVVIDASYLVYVTHNTSLKELSEKPIEITSTINIIDTSSDVNDAKTDLVHSISLLSDINDFKITHDLSSSDRAVELFSSSEENKETIQHNLDKTEETSESISIAA